MIQSSKNIKKLKSEIPKRNRRESWVYYFSLYLTSISYTLAITTFTERNLRDIQQKATELMLPKLGYNRKISRALVYGPVSHGGIGLYHLYGEQGRMQIYQFVKFWRYDYLRISGYEQSNIL